MELRTVACIVILFMNIDSINGVENDIAKISPDHEPDDICDIEQLSRETGMIVQTCDKTFDGLQSCLVRDGENDFVYNCLEESWKLSSGTGHHLRRKRFIPVPWFYGVLIVLAVVCSNTDKCEGKKSNTPPKFTFCPKSGKTYTAYIKEKSVKVRWVEPVAKDDEKVKMVNQTHFSGHTFGGSPKGEKYTVAYIAKDANDLSATCCFSFTVKYKTCHALAAPRNGSHICSHGSIYGSECVAICDAGYEIVYKTTARCQSDETWDNIPSCQKIACSVPFKLTNGSVICSDDQYRFEGYCHFECDKGFGLIGPARMNCQADKKWSVAASDVACIDNEPPKISCLSQQMFYADRGGLTTSVTWEEPSATDNVDSTPIINKLAAISQGDILSEGNYFVTYEATDSQGNTFPALSKCMIELEVKAIKCPSGPYGALETPRFIKFNCSDTIYYDGVTCDLGCELNIQINGSDRMSCDRKGTSSEGEWVFESDQQPFCQVNTCPPLEPPDNGAFITDSINARPLHVMLCEKGYDIPAVGHAFQGRLSCQDSGKWYPFQEFPDCIKAVFSQTRLPAELIYEGNCSDNSTPERIKAQALIYLSSVKEDIDKSICPNKKTCKVENLVIVCGANSRKRRRSDQSPTIHKRQIENVVVKFEIVIPIDIENKTAENAYLDNLDVFANITGLIQTYVDEGKFDITNLSLPSFEHDSSPNIVCPDEGYKFELGSMKCKPCPRGTFLNSTTDMCEFCDFGEYMEHDAAIKCISCPDGFSTDKIGSKDKANCIKLCSPGFVSPTSMEPCNACQVSSYQPLQGQIYCESCPLGTTTKGTNSVSAEECDVFDIYIGHSEQESVIGTFDAEESAYLALSFWIRPRIPDRLHLAIHIEDTIGDIINLDVSDSVTIKFGSSSLSTSNGTFHKDRWTHVACNVNLSSGETELFIGGKLVINKVKASNDVLRTISNGSVMVKQMSTGVYLSGFLLVSRHIDETYIRSLSQSCAVNVNDPILSMSDLLHNLRLGDSVIMPSTCDAIDECATGVCGIHECINKMDGFECICLQGMKGELCDIPPDYCLDNFCENGECISENRTYRCNCADGYTGPLCNRPPVNGGWSEWQDWSSCSSTCGGGTRDRSRKCNAPSPGFLGLDCIGNGTEIEVCNDFICPKCTQLNSNYDMLVACNSSEELNECSVECVMGKLFANGQTPFEKYKCGQTTGYLWEPTDQLPTCVDVNVPDRLGTRASVNYTTDVPDINKDAVIHSVEQKLNASKCKTCNLKAEFEPNDLTNQSTTSTLTLQFSKDLKGDGNISLADYLTNGTETPAMTELLETFRSLNEMAELIQNNSTDIFDVVVDDVEYTSENSSVSFVGTVTCPDGYAGADGLCAKCAEGTKLNFPNCLSCEIGTYQPLSGQSDCLPCPDGYTTSHFGSSSISNCSVPLQTHSSTVRMVTTTDNEKDYVNGGWSEWQDWSTCSSTCGGGTRHRNRECDAPSPGLLGLDCLGNGTEIEVCNDLMCPVNGGWSEWQDWSSCSSTCGDGTRDRSRKCNAPSPKFFGLDCIGNGTEIEVCNDLMCPVNGEWSEWQDWSSCSSTCGGGTRDRSRKCNAPSPGFLGLDCIGNETEIEVCNDLMCPVNGGWSRWQDWSSCSSTCGGGTRDRHRKCNAPSPRFLGLDCIGNETEIEVCNDLMCPAQCAEGTKLSFHDCVNCENGTYQPLPGQSDCLPCPDGYTTPNTGSSNISNCSVPLQTNSSTVRTVAKSDNDSDIVILIGAIIGGIIFISIAVIAIIIAVRNYRRRELGKIQPPGRFIDLIMVRLKSMVSTEDQNDKPKQEAEDFASLQQRAQYENLRLTVPTRNRQE